MQRFVNKVGPLRTIAWNRTAKQFCAAEQACGVRLSGRDAPAALARIRTVLIDASLMMEGWDAVRMAAVPLTICPIEKFKRQGSWMMLTAGVSLGSDGCGPLENFAREMHFESARMARQYPVVFAAKATGGRSVETSIHRDGDAFRAFAKGGTGAILRCCALVLDGKERPMNDDDVRRASRSAAEMEGYGLEAVAFATRRLRAADAADAEQGMTFLGIIGMGDLPTEQTPEQIRHLRAIGMRPVFTAKTFYTEGAIRASGILREGAAVLCASELPFHSAGLLGNAGLSADAFVNLDDGMRRRLAWAIRRHEHTAILAQMPDGEASLTTGATGAEDAVFQGGLTEAVSLLVRCRKALERFS